MSTIINTVNEFDQLKNEYPYVVADFFATWCYPCKMLSPVLEKVEENTPNVKFVKIDVDKSTDIAIQYKIEAMPSLVFIKNGVTMGLELGFMEESKIKQLINKYFG
ncbi:MAG: thioredoxin [Clostridia bacterium]|nr:thioredoxin [Clostridia bacterium]